MLLSRDGAAFTTSWIEYLESAPAFSMDASRKIYVPIFLPDLGRRALALVDPGTPWTILGHNLVELLGLLGCAGPTVALSTRHGIRRGTLERLALTLLADSGAPLDVDATIFACDWPDPDVVILGYEGLLSRIRFAVEPGPQRFHFGPSPF